MTRFHYAHSTPINISHIYRHFVNDLPKVVREDVNYKIKARKRRSSATTENVALFAAEAVKEAKTLSTFITDKFPFAYADNCYKKRKQVFLSHDVLMSDENVKALAIKMTSEFERYLSETQINEESFTGYLGALEDAFNKISALMLECFIKPPEVNLSGIGEKISLNDAELILEVAIKRCLDASYLIKKFKRLRKQYIEHSQIALGNLGRKKRQHKYISRRSLARFKHQMIQAEDFLESMTVINQDTLQEFNLKEVAERTTANPKNRRVELIVRARGEEERAIDMGYEGVFLTWTLPSKYHRNDDEWNGCTVKEAHQNLMQQWKLARAHFKKHDILWFGLRVAEPHKDGTPHAHMFLYTPENQQQQLVNICQEIATSEDRAELYNNKGRYCPSRRFKAKPCDPNKGSATGYCIKYISKNINGAHMEEAEAEYNALSVRAWSSTWGIRQFSQSGSPPVSLWRQLRRANPLDVAFDEELFTLREHADKSRWKGFCELGHKARLAHEEKLNKYGEINKRVIGIDWFGKIIKTCAEQYALVRNCDVARFKESRSDSPWSTENKCNPPKEKPISPLEKALMDVTGWSVKGIQCLLKPLALGASVPIDKHTTLKLRNNQLMTT